TGPSGAQKTELLALMQQHFGANWSRLKLPVNWSCTANFIQRMLYTAKDVITVIDDFVADGGNRAATQQLQQKAEQVFRGIGNNQGRGRLNSNIEFRPMYSPRGFVLSSGEDTPRGHSLNARLFVV